MGEALIADDKDSLTWATSPLARLAEESSPPKKEDALPSVPASMAGSPHVMHGDPDGRPQGEGVNEHREASPPVRAEDACPAVVHESEPRESRSPSTETECRP